jgi:hypothetical protein
LWAPPPHRGDSPPQKKKTNNPPPPPPPDEQLTEQAAEPIVAAAVPEPPIAASEQSNIQIHFGARLGFGISALRGHKALQSVSFAPHAIRLKSAFSFGIGIASAIEINSLVTAAPELQYVWYRSNGEFTQKNNAGFPDLNEAGVSLHSFELPLLARFNLESAFGRVLGQVLYAEVGPQFGYNYYSKIYINSESKKPESNAFAFGPSLGFGVNANEALLGIRAYLGLLEYAKNTSGRPWTVQISATKFIF